MKQKLLNFFGVYAKMGLKWNKLFQNQYFKYFSQIFLITILTTGLVLGIAKATHLFDGKNGQDGRTPDTSQNNPYIDNPDNDSTIALINSFLPKLQLPSEENIHLATAGIVDPREPDGDAPKYWNNGRYLEKPQDVWNGQHHNEPWYLSEIWWPNNDDDYDFQIKNFYLNNLKNILIEINKFLTVYQIRVNGEFQTQKSSLQYQDNPTNITLDISNRSVYGLTVNSVNFQLQTKIPSIPGKDDWSEAKNFTIKYPKAIEVKKKVLNNNVAWYGTIVDENDNLVAPYNQYILSNSVPIFDPSDKNMNYSKLDRSKFHKNIYFHYLNDQILKDFWEHIKAHLTIPLNNPRDIDNKRIKISYIFNFNKFEIDLDDDNQNPNYGFYLITQIHCNHTNNRNRDDGKWIR